MQTLYYIKNVILSNVKITTKFIFFLVFQFLSGLDEDLSPTTSLHHTGNHDDPMHEVPLESNDELPDICIDQTHQSLIHMRLMVLKKE